MCRPTITFPLPFESKCNYERGESQIRFTHLKAYNLKRCIG